jgi:hypothetical protein
MEKKELKNLHPNEISLLEKIRTKYRFSEITIIVQDGIPLRIKEVVTSETLTITNNNGRIKNQGSGF